MGIKSLLRYNSRIHVLFPKTGKPQINPITYRTGDQSYHEPLWIFRFRQRLFAFAGNHRCGRRGESWVGQAKHFGGDKELPDTWDLGPDGNRTCSYCGSIHFDDLMKIAELSLTTEGYGIDGTDKGYKYYVKQPNVRNAGEGAIKYYTAHTPEDFSPDHEILFKAALRKSRERWDAYFAKTRAEMIAKSAAGGQ